ncbi:Na+/H+ antiporter [Vagococcus intermedius]|uniref:Na+/H+ antiporter n=1 Tax=Vagococcus intermedius TaxID=2991418 RepID=A0AAF0CU84_9ENTE|nr:Na+/H+ antiporter [Vagococcus intermedius]WEG72949.1 Na+/H+ antiporter [Vagococcus intermedius]WEG75035.1 Na+/H+ antiporter [Vagococcus intermedius]
MTVLVASIFMIVLVIISNIISHYLVSIPTALIEIAVGLIVALALDINITLEADWFMLLFVAPLLFNDGKMFPKNELWELKTPIFAYAIWLVLLTTVTGGFFIHWLIPDVPLPLAMALVAVLSPTDPVAVHGIAEQIKLPKKILSLISGESLINDASGLIAFKYALAAFMTGHFSLTKATGDFFYMALVGVLVGILCISFIHFLRLVLVQQGIHDAVLHTTIQLLTPFIIYILADEVLGASGVIAVVSAGVLSINQTPIFRSRHSEARLITNKMWDMLVYLLNGLVFVLLGIELPIAMRETIVNPAIHNGTLLFYILSIWIFLLIVRVVWSYIYMWLTYLKKNNANSDNALTRPTFITALMTGLTGVRGAVTMASIMSMPFFLPNGEVFIERPLIITLACGVVLTSLIVATITLPILTKQKQRLPLVGNESQSQKIQPSESSHSQNRTRLTELEARQIMVKEAITILKQETQNSDDHMILTDLIQEFESRLRHLYREHNDEQTNRLYSRLEKNVQDIAIQGERHGVEKMLANGDVSELMVKNYLKVVTAKREAFESGALNAFKRYLFVLKRQTNVAFWRFKSAQHQEDILLADTILIKLETESTKGAIDSLKNYKKTLNTNDDGYDLHKHIVNQKLYEYLHKLNRIKNFSQKSKHDYQKLVQEFYMKALDAERETVQELYQQGKITLQMANHLRQSLNYYESSLLQSEASN